MTKPIDPALLRGLTQRRVSRRNLFKISGVGAAAMGLAACGVKGAGTTPAPSASDFWAGKASTGKVSVASWDAYMGKDDAGNYPQLEAFTQQTGITVNYDVVINDLAEFFTTTQPKLAIGQSIGYDVMIVTNGVEFGKYVAGNYLAPLDLSRLPNVTAHIASAYTKEAFDPGNKWSVPWASGFTGLGYDPAKVSRPLTSLNDLLDPSVVGTEKVGMMGDIYELGNFALWAVGVNPSKSTKDDWNKAADWLKRLQDAGTVFSWTYGNDYLQGLEGGDIAVSMAWSGDILQEQFSGLAYDFIIPSEGGTIWTDNMTIPITADSPVDALTYINYWYDPAVSAKWIEDNGYATGVDGAQAIVQADADAETDPTAKAQLQLTAGPEIFPSAADLAKLSPYVTFASDADQADYEDIFNPFIGA